MARQRTLITGGLVLVGDPLNGKCERTDVLVEDGVITAIGTGWDRADAERVDARGRLVVPGFVDSHQHLWQTTMRGLTADWDLKDYFWRIRMNHTAQHGAEDVYAGTYVGALASLDNGVTTTSDYSHALLSPDHADEAVRAVTDAGLRARWFYGLYDPPTANPVFTDAEQRWADARRVRSTHFSGNDARTDRVTMGVALTELGLRPWKETEGEFRLAADLDVSLTAHTNVVWGPGHGTSEIETYHRHGLLGPGQLHSHANTSTDHELRLLADAGATTSSTPDTELQMGMGSPVWARAAAAGVHVGLGADIQSNNSSDPWAQMRLALQAENLRASLPVLGTDGLVGLTGAPATPRQVLYHATLGSARALGLGDVTGSLDVGKHADLLLVRVGGLGQRPIVNPLHTLVLHCGPADLDTVMVGGDIVKHGGRLTHRDPVAAAMLLEAAHERVSERVTARGGWTPPTPPTFLHQVMDTMVANAPGEPADPVAS
ncbi:MULTISPECIES: amidohydrolase family protein [unclassified Nocardiopsis]|uniref:amidohydrolase family protein n=1 Tax=unclassified Nocardiopsis TaxID=2649073 RepID=UPI0033E68567